MNSYSVIKSIYLTSKHLSTLNTIQRVGNEIMMKPHKLEIVNYPGDPGFYLLYFGINDEELTDTYHDNIDSALQQAKWEFNINIDEWK